MKKILSTNKYKIAYAILIIALIALACTLSFNAGVRWSVSHGALSVLLEDANFEKRLRQELGQQLRANEREKWANSVVCRTDTIEVYVDGHEAPAKSWDNLSVDQKRQVVAKKQALMSEEDRKRHAHEWLFKKAQEMKEAKGR